MNVWSAEAGRWWLSLRRSRRLTWAVLVSVVLPGVGVGSYAHWSGAPPVVTVAGWLVVIPILPLYFVLQGMHWAEPEGEAGVGAYKAAWPTPFSTRWSVQAALMAVVTGVQSVLTAAVLLGLLIPWGQVTPVYVVGAGLTAWAMLWAASWFMMAWGWLAASWLPGVWGQLVGVLLPVAGLLVGALVAGLAGNAWGAVLSLVAMTPIGFLENKGSDIWGFGLYRGQYYAVLTLTLLGSLTAVGVGLGRQGATNRQIPWILALAAVGSLAFFLVVGQDAYRENLTVAWPPRALSVSHVGRVRREDLTISVSSQGIIHGVAQITVARGQDRLVLDSSLHISAFQQGGQVLPYRRGPDGLLTFTSRGGSPVVLTYWGQPELLAASYPAPSTPLRQTVQGAVAAVFSTGTGALLPAGSWYPMPAGDLLADSAPPVLSWQLHIIRSPWHAVVTNVGVLGPSGTLHWHRTTGITLVAGWLYPSHLGGLTVWSGPESRTAWRRDFWDSEPYRWGVRYGLTQRALAVGAAVGTLNAVSSMWGASASAIVPMTNPNPRVVQNFPPAIGLPGLMGTLVDVGYTYQFAAESFSAADIEGIWSYLSPRWIDLNWTTLGGFRHPIAQDPSQLVLASLQNSIVVPGLMVGVSAPPAVHQASLSFRGWTMKRYRRFFRAFQKASQHGWVTEAELGRLIKAP